MRRLPALPLVLALLLIAGPPSGRAEDPGDASVLGFVGPRRGEVIADVGCGRGAWTFPLAMAVGAEGRVFAVDIDANSIREVRRRVKEEAIGNVEVIHSVPDDPLLPKDTLDAVFLNDVIDYVERPALAGFLCRIRDALKPGGRLVIRDPNGGADRVIAELYRSGFALIEARIPLEDTPHRSFATGWYALKLRRAEIQPAILPRLDRPARYRFRLHLAEELFRMGLIDRETLRDKWRKIRDQPGTFDPGSDEARDLIHAAGALGVLTDGEVKRMLEALGPR